MSHPMKRQVRKAPTIIPLSLHLSLFGTHGFGQHPDQKGSYFSDKDYVDDQEATSSHFSCPVSILCLLIFNNLHPSLLRQRTTVEILTW